jgi:hypothetical protein
VLTLPKEKIMNAIATVLGSCLFPVAISCVLYASMICIKKRKFLNIIGPITKTLNDANIESVIHGSNETSLEEIMQDQTNNEDAQEVIQIFSEISLHS